MSCLTDNISLQALLVSVSLGLNKEYCRRPAVPDDPSGVHAGIYRLCTAGELVLGPDLVVVLSAKGVGLGFDFQEQVLGVIMAEDGEDI